jgi:hypothetical protein
MRLLAAPDKFRGTLTAREAAAAIAGGAERAGWSAVQLPLADGGEGTLDVLGGGNRRTVVSGPLGEPVEAEWRLEDDGTALIEAALACGLTLAGGPERNDPLAATSRGVGELIAAAAADGAERIVVAVGGVASTDGVSARQRPSRSRSSSRSRSPATSTRAFSTQPTSSRRRREPRLSRCESCVSGSASSSSRTCPGQARRAASPVASRQLALASSPASTSSPGDSASPTGLRRLMSS